MRNRRWSNNDRHLWPFTLSVGDYKRLGFVIDSGAHEDGHGDCHIRLYLFSVTLICELPRIVKNFSIRHWPEWDARTVARLGRNWYDELHPREYGFAFIEGNLHMWFGPQTHDSRTTKGRVFFLPWRNWRHVRRSLYDLDARHMWTERDVDSVPCENSSAWEKTCPKARFEFQDYDGEKIIATTHIEEREWRFGTGYFKWLSLLRQPKIVRSLKIEFSSEVGTEKGSWKGGMLGTGIEMLPGELHEAAFKRYCDKELRAKSAKFRIRYVGPLQPMHAPNVA